MTTLKDNGLVEFRFFRPEAHRVKIAGSFSNWKPLVDMTPEPDGEKGWWQVRLPIPPGEYRFRYEVDGRWFTDFGAHGVEVSENRFDSVLVVPLKVTKENDN